MVEVEIKVRNLKMAKRLAKHIEDTHPSTRGKVSVENECSKKMLKRGVGLAKGTNKFVKKMLKNTPDFNKAAAKVTQL